MDMSDLPNLARSLHSSRKLTPAQIRNRTGFLDSNDRPFIALETIQGWLADTQAPRTQSEARPSTASISDQPKPVLMAAMPPETWLLDPAGQDIVAQHLRRQAEDSRMLQTKVAQLEAQLRRQSAEFARRTPSPTYSPQASPGRRSRTPSPIMEPQDNNRELIDQLKQMNTQLMAQLATASQLVSSVLGTVDRRTSAPPASHPEAKPFKDWIPQVEPYSGEAKRAPEAFLAQFRLYARQNSVPDTERARQLIGKLTGPAQLWYTLTFANDPTTATEAQIALGLRKAFGQEYAGVRALRAMFHVTAQPTQSGAQRLLALDQREEQARQLRVPLDAGPAETRFSRVLALFLDEELNPFLSELTADPRCSEEALRQLEEAGDRADTVRPPSLATASPSREELFTLRVQLAEAALRRLHAHPPGTSRARLARAEGTEAPAPASPAPPPQSATPPAAPVARAAGTSNPLLATCSQLTADYKKQSAGTGFTGPPHYFGQNKDASTREKNQAELKRRREAGFCFKCRMTDVQEVPYLECPLHGALASPSADPPTVGRTRRG